jgi:hypothetical protein
VQCWRCAQAEREMLPDALKIGHLLLTSSELNKHSALGY